MSDLEEEKKQNSSTGLPDWDALSLPKHRRLQLLLEEKIRRGEYGPGQRIPTEKNLMADHGLSHATVSRAVRQLARAGLVTRKRKSGTYVTPNPNNFTAPFPAAPVSNALGLFHFYRGEPAAFHPFFTSLFNSFLKASDSRGMTAKLIEMEQSGMPMNERFLEQHGIAGCAVMFAVKRNLEEALRLNIPLVFLSHSWPELVVDRVVVEVDEGLSRVFSRFREAGHKRVAVLDTRRHFDRLEERVAAEYDCLPTEAPVDLILSPWTERGAQEAFAAWQALPERPTALFVGDDFLLMHFLRVAAKAGLTAPRDFSVIGYGTTFSPLLLGEEVSLLEYDTQAMAAGVVDLLMDQILNRREPGRRLSIPTRLIARVSG